MSIFDDDLTKGIFDDLIAQPLHLGPKSIPTHYSVWGNTYNPKYKIKSPTKIKFPNVSDASQRYGPVDIETYTTMACTLAQALTCVENAAYEYFHARGEETIEHYVITDIEFLDDCIVFRKKKICNEEF